MFYFTGPSSRASEVRSQSQSVYSHGSVGQVAKSRSYLASRVIQAMRRGFSRQGLYK